MPSPSEVAMKNVSAPLPVQPHPAMPGRFDREHPDRRRGAKSLIERVANTGAGVDGERAGVLGVEEAGLPGEQRRP